MGDITCVHCTTARVNIRENRRHQGVDKKHAMNLLKTAEQQKRRDETWSLECLWDDFLRLLTSAGDTVSVMALNTHRTDEST